MSVQGPEGTGQDLMPAGDAAVADPPASSWRTGNRAIVVLAVVAVVGLVAGLVLSRFVVNPAEAAARTAPPEAGPITVPVESRELSNEVTIRGDVVYDDAVDVRVETASLDQRAVVTGQVPEVGATLDAGSVALEIAGRPVIVLPGALPTYRTLRSGVSGPDVVQLKQALGALGIAAGDVTSDVYDDATAAGVRALYQRAGYPAPTPSDEQSEAVRMAEQSVRSAQSAVTDAQTALTRAAAGAAGSTVLEADQQVNAALRARDAARQTLDETRAACGAGTASPETDCSAAGDRARQNELADAEDALSLAQAKRTEAGAPADTSAERSSLTAAQQMLTDAKSDLADAQAETLTALPASEVVYLETVPRRVDAVSVKRGGTVDGSVMSVSGATLQVVASAARADAALLEVGATGTITVDGAEVPVTVTEIAAASGGSGSGDGSEGGGSGSGSGSESGRSTVTFRPEGLTPEQVATLQGTNVRVSVPVSSTGGAVLAVPLAAITAGPGGESRVEVLADGASTLVEVTTGLAAGGYVEVTGVGQELHEDDLVVVGTTGGAGAEATTAPDEEGDA